MTLIEAVRRAASLIVGQDLFIRSFGTRESLWAIIQGDREVARIAWAVDTGPSENDWSALVTVASPTMADVFDLRDIVNAGTTPAELASILDLTD